MRVFMRAALCAQGGGSQLTYQHVLALTVSVGEGRVQESIALASQGAPSHQLRRVPIAQPAEERRRVSGDKNRCVQVQR